VINTELVGVETESAVGDQVQCHHHRWGADKERHARGGRYALEGQSDRGGALHGVYGSSEVECVGRRAFAGRAMRARMSGDRKGRAMWSRGRASRATVSRLSKRHVATSRQATPLTCRAARERLRWCPCVGRAVSRVYDTRRVRAQGRGERVRPGGLTTATSERQNSRSRRSSAHPATSAGASCQAALRCAIVRTAIMSNRSRAANDVIALTVLALTSERPRHPYDIQRAIRDRHKDFAAGKTRALYRAVDRLEQDGLIAPVETSREGKRPERTVYQVTDEGAEELEGWLGELLEVARPEFPLYSVALSFAAYVPAEVVIDRLQARTVELRAAVAGAEAALKSLLEDMRLPRAVLLDSELTLAMRKAELDWTRGLIEQLRSKRLWWTPDTLRHEFDQNGSRARDDRHD